MRMAHRAWSRAKKEEENILTLIALRFALCALRTYCSGYEVVLKVWLGLEKSTSLPRETGAINSLGISDKNNEG
jgi:hypothetical protein